MIYLIPTTSVGRTDNTNIPSSFLGTTIHYNYLDRMGLTHSRIWIRYRARAVKGVKANRKRSWKKNLECRFCDNKILETQEHLEECGGLSWERRGLKLDTVEGKINFFKRVEKKLG